MFARGRFCARSSATRSLEGSLPSIKRFVARPCAEWSRCRHGGCAVIPDEKRYGAVRASQRKPAMKVCVF
jgi:hypothetical protein